MNIKHFDSTKLTYTQSVEISECKELLFIIGQVPKVENESTIIIF